MAFSPQEVLAKNRRDAMQMVERVGVVRTRKILETSQRDLERRIRTAVKGPGDASFTAVQMRATMVQLKQVLRELVPGMKGIIVGGAADVAEHAAGGVVEYLTSAEERFRGVGTQPLALDEASVLDAASQGAQASALRRLASSGELVANAEDEPHPAKQGILDRYGMNVVENIEGVLQQGLLTRASFDTMRARIIETSPFLQGAPASWAERITRTELIGSYNRAGWESQREANEQLGDMVKILAATFDARTAADSFSVHGQIRRPDEAFETWYGLMQHPPARPNDREIVVPHRISWPLPKYLQWRSRAEVAARWKAEGRKGAPPAAIRDMTTVPLSEFGKPQTSPLS